MNKIALGCLPESPLPRPGDYLPHRSGDRSDRCVVHRPEGHPDRCSPECFPLSYAGYSDYNGVSYDPRCSAPCPLSCSDHCGLSRRPRCSPRSSGRCLPDCGWSYFQSCSTRCSARGMLRSSLNRHEIPRSGRNNRPLGLLVGSRLRSFVPCWQLSRDPGDADGQSKSPFVIQAAPQRTLRTCRRQAAARRTRGSSPRSPAFEADAARLRAGTVRSRGGRTPP